MANRTKAPTRRHVISVSLPDEVYRRIKAQEPVQRGTQTLSSWVAVAAMERLDPPRRGRQQQRAAA